MSATVTSRKPTSPTAAITARSKRSRWASRTSSAGNPLRPRGRPGSREGEPGLPRGRSGLPADEVREAQRERLLRAVIAAVGEVGFREVTVADIVRGARVSRAAFYAHFADKEDCFLAATRVGGLLMADRVVSATRKLPDDAS